MKSILILLFVLLSCTTYAQYQLFNESLKNKNEKVLVNGFPNRVVVKGLTSEGYQIQIREQSARINVDSYQTLIIYPPDQEVLVLDIVAHGETVMYDTFAIRKVSDAMLFIGSSYNYEMSPEEIIKDSKLKIDFKPDILEDYYYVLIYSMCHQVDTGWFEVPAYPAENKIFYDTLWFIDPETGKEFFEIREVDGNIPSNSEKGNQLSDEHQKYILQLSPGSALRFEAVATCPDCRLRNFEYQLKIK